MEKGSYTLGVCILYTQCYTAKSIRLLYNKTNIVILSSLRIFQIVDIELEYNAGPGTG